MLLTRNLHHYRFSSFVIISSFILVFVFSANLPIWIDNQQTTFVEVNARDIIFHFRFSTSTHLFPNHTLDSNLETHPAVNTAISVEHFHESSALGSKNSTLDYIQSLPYSDFGGISFFTFSNDSYTELKTRLGLNHSSSLTSNEIIVNYPAAQKWNLLPGDSFFIAKNNTVVHTLEGPTGSEDPVELSFTVVDSLSDSFSDPLFDRIFRDFHSFSYRIRSNIPFLIVSNEMLASIKQAFEPTWNYNHHYTYVLLDETVIQYNDLKGSLNQLAAIGDSLYNQVGREDVYLSKLAIYELQEIYSTLIFLQLLFSLLIIPSLAISAVILLKVIQHWTSTRLSELQILYRRGSSENDILQQIRRELIQFLITGFVLAGIFTLILSWLLEFNLTNSLLMFLLLGLLLMFLFLQFIKSRFIRLSVTREQGEQARWELKRGHYLVIAIGLFPLVLELVISINLLQTGFFRILENAIAPFYPFLLILTPLFGLYGSGLLVFIFFNFIGNKMPRKLHASFVIQDINRNAREVFQVLLLLSLGLTIALGPVIANDMITDHDRRQLEAYYGAEYTTGFISPIGNYTTIEERLDSIDGLSWAAVIDIEGITHIETADGPSFSTKILLASDNYFQILMPACRNRIPTGLQESFESSKKAVFLQQRTLESETFNYYSFVDILFVDLYEHHDFEPVQYAFSGSFSYLPGAYIGNWGYVPPFTDPSIFGTWYQENILFTHLTDEYISIDFTTFDMGFINFLFDLSNFDDVKAIIDQIQDVVGVPVKSYSVASESDVYGKQPQTRVLQSLFFALTCLNLALLLLFMLVFFQSYLLQRRLELGIFRVRGYSKSQVYRLITAEFLLVIIGGIVWSLTHVFLYGISIANYAVFNDLFPPRIVVGEETIILSSIIIFILIIIGLARPLIYYRHTLSYLLQRRT